MTTSQTPVEGLAVFILKMVVAIIACVAAWYLALWGFWFLTPRLSASLLDNIITSIAPTLAALGGLIMASRSAGASRSTRRSVNGEMARIREELRKTIQALERVAEQNSYTVRALEKRLEAQDKHIRDNIRAQGAHPERYRPPCPSPSTDPVGPDGD